MDLFSVDCVVYLCSRTEYMNLSKTVKNTLFGGWTELEIVTMLNNICEAVKMTPTKREEYAVIVTQSAPVSPAIDEALNSLASLNVHIKFEEHGMY